MTRSLTTAIKTALATNDIRPVHLITIGFSTPVNITDCSFSLTSSVSGSSVTYNSSDFIMGLSEFSEQTDISKTSVKLTLSGADQTFISTVLNENVTNDVQEFGAVGNDKNGNLLYQFELDVEETL